MKKVLILFVLLAFCLSFAGCKPKETETAGPATDI